MNLAAAPDAEGQAPAELDLGLTAGFIGPKVRVLWNLLSARMVTRLAPFGLRSGAFSTLALIAANPGCSQNQLADALGMDKSALVAIIDELESRGLTKRVRPAHDRRRHALTLTKQGQAQVHRMMEPVSQVGEPIREALSKSEMDDLLSLLDRAYSALAAAEP